MVSRRRSTASTSSAIEVKRAVCTVCDIACQLHVHVHVRDGAVDRVTRPTNPVTKDHFCVKGLSAAEPLCPP